MTSLSVLGVTIDPLGILLAALFLSLMFFLFRWMFAVPPQAPMEVINVKTTLSNLNRIIVPIVETVASERAVELAARLASDQKSEIILAFVIVIPLSLGLDASMPRLEQEAARALDTGEFLVKQHKLKCEKRVVRARTAAEGILQLVREVDADVVVMGAGVPQRRNFAETSATATELFRRAPCEVIVSKAPIPV